MPARIISVVAAADIAGFVEQTKIGDLVADRKRAGLAVVREVLVVLANGFGNTRVTGTAVRIDDVLLNFLRGPVRRTFGVEIVAADNRRTAHGFGCIAVHKNEIADAGDDSDVRADRAGIENFGAAVGNLDGIVRRAEDNGGLPVISNSLGVLKRQRARTEIDRRVESALAFFVADSPGFDRAARHGEAAEIAFVRSTRSGAVAHEVDHAAVVKDERCPGKRIAAPAG